MNLSLAEARVLTRREIQERAHARMVAAIKPALEASPIRLRKCRIIAAEMKATRAARRAAHAEMMAARKTAT